MAASAPIPTPARQRFREFRVRFLPPIVFVSTLLAIFWVWRDYVTPPTLVGQVEPVVASVTSRNAGILTNLFVQRFEEVRAGQIIAEVRVTDRRRYDTELDFLRSQISLAQLELGTYADRQRLALDYENLRVDYMREQTALEIARAELPHAKFDVDLSKRLLTEKVVSEFEYESFLSKYDALKAQVEQLQKNVKVLEDKLANARDAAETALNSAESKELLDRLDRLQKEQQRLEALGAAPMPIEAPIDGVVTEILRRPGENLLPGEPILTLSARQSQRIVGYLRPPFTMVPEPGTEVHLRSRNFPRADAVAKVSGIGAALEIIQNAALTRPNGPPELGLPIAIAIPASLAETLRPGELVDIHIPHP